MILQELFENNYHDVGPLPNGPSNNDSPTAKGDWFKYRIDKAIQKYGCGKVSTIIQQAYEMGIIDEKTARNLMKVCDMNDPSTKIDDPSGNVPHVYDPENDGDRQQRTQKYKLR